MKLSETDKCVLNKPQDISVREYCAKYGMSRQTYYVTRNKLISQGYLAADRDKPQSLEFWVHYIKEATEPEEYLYLVEDKLVQQQLLPDNIIQSPIIPKGRWLYLWDKYKRLRKSDSFENSLKGIKLSKKEFFRYVTYFDYSRFLFAEDKYQYWQYILKMSENIPVTMSKSVWSGFLHRDPCTLNQWKRRLANATAL